MKKALWILIYIIIIRLLESENPMICQTNKAGQLYKIAEMVNCDHQEPKNAKILLYKRNIKEYTVEAWSLKVVKRYCLATFGFFGSKTRILRQENVLWTEERMKEHIKEHTCESTDGNIVNGQTFHNDFECNFKWSRTIETSTLSCYYNNGKVISTHDNFLFSNLGNMHHCNYSKGYCNTNDHVAITWIASEEVKKPYIYTGKYDAVVLGTHYILVKAGLSFELTKMKKVGNTFQDQGFQIIIENNTIPSQRNVTELLKSTIDDTIITLKNEINKKFEFLYDLIVSPAAKIGSLCQAIQLNNLLSRAIAMSDATSYIRVMLNNSYVVGKLTAQKYILAWPCLMIKEHKWNAKTNDCFNWIPIIYKMGDKWIEGFIDAKNNIIHKTSSKINCQEATNQFFSLNKQLYIYKPGFLPKKIDKKQAIKLPSLIANDSDWMKGYDGTWIFNESDYQHINQGAAVMDYISDKIKDLEDGLNQEINNKDITNGLDFLGLNKLSIGNLVNTITEWIFRGLAGLGAIAFFTK